VDFLAKHGYLLTQLFNEMKSIRYKQEWFKAIEIELLANGKSSGRK
jgi:hypothetical protein